MRGFARRFLTAAAPPTRRLVDEPPGAGASQRVDQVLHAACGDTWRSIRDDLKHMKLAQLSGPNGTVWQVTEPRPEARNRLTSLGVYNLPTLLDPA
jgi:hypothetical protein